MALPKKMTTAQLKAVAADYVSAFPEWEPFKGTAFVRETGPVQQMVWFEALRTGEYRPICGISATPMPMARMLDQMLDVTNRQTSLKQHPVRQAQIRSAMEQQFRPHIRKPLDVAEVLALCEAEAQPDATNDLAMLAILYTWLDRKAEALDCCERMQHCPLPTLAPMPDWEDAMRAFGRDLAKAVEAGRSRKFLETAMENATA